MTNPNIHHTADVLITNGHVLTMDGKYTEFKNGAVGIKDGKIIKVGPSKQLNDSVHPEYVVDARGGLIIPGFINGHCHAAMTLFRGVAGDRALDDFLETIWKVERTHVNRKSVHAGAFIGCAEMAMAGITTFTDMYWHPTETLKAAVTVGLNIVTGPVFVGFEGADRVEDWSQKITDAKVFLETHKGMEGVHLSLAPHGAYTLDEEQMREVASLAKVYDVPIQMHAAEAPSEMDQVREMYGRTPIEVLRDTGLLDGHAMIAHGVHLSDADIEILKMSGAGIVHCPLSNAKTAAGTARVGALSKASVPVGLGTDGPSTGNDLDIFKAMRHAAMMQVLENKDPSIIPARQVVKMATSGGANAIGLSELTGSLERGKQADIVVVSTENYHMLNQHDPYSALVYSAGRDDVRDVFSRRHRIVKGGRIVTPEIDKLIPKFKIFAEFVSSHGKKNHGL